MLFFAPCGDRILGYLNITEAAFKIACGIILAGLSVQYVIDRLGDNGVVTL